MLGHNEDDPCIGRKRKPGCMNSSDTNTKLPPFYFADFITRVAGSNPQKCQYNKTSKDEPISQTESDGDSRTSENKDSEDAKSSDFNILLFGETGSGKSTLVNTITNCCRGGTLEKLRVSIKTKYLSPTEEFISRELHVDNPTVSKTDDCNFYRLNFGGSNFNLIDTPGLSDTRGTEQDDKNLDKIAQAAVDAKIINAIIFIINGTTPRLTVNLRNVIRRLRGFLPDILLQNVLVVFTNCYEHTCNFDIGSLQEEFVPKKVFHMNNSAFSSDPKKWAKRALQDLQREWDSSMDVIDEIFKTVVSMNATISSAFEDIKRSRHEIKERLHDTRLRITQLQAIQDELMIAEKVLTKYGDDERQFANYTQKKTIRKTEIVDALHHSTICGQCTEICHDRCGLNEISLYGSNAFKNCACMNGGDNCNKCRNRCSYIFHYHAKKTLQITEQTLDDVIEETKAKYDAAQAGKNKQTTRVRSLTDAKKIMKEAITAMTQSIIKECINLKKICSGFNLVDELHVMLSQLKMEARLLQSIEARNTAEHFIHSLQKICDELSYSTESKQKNK